jgi:hypothetical protein
MELRRFGAGLTLVAVMALPIIVSQSDVFAAGAPKAEWRPSAKTKTTTKSKATKAPARSVEQPTPARPATGTPPPPPAAAPTNVPDQSQDVLDVDFAMAASIAAQGPKEGYGASLSEEGVLYDANGASPAGREAANSRFGSFPADVKLIRTPERALAAGGSGSSWGTYSIKRGEAVLSAGRYVSVWRLEASGWKMISELAAGRTFAPPPPTPISGVLPKRPVSLGRAAPSPVGVPLTVPQAPATPPASETPPTP